MIIEGVVVLITGMIVVFLFLGIMVGLMKATAFFMYDEKDFIEINKKANDEIAIAIAVARTALKGNE